MLPAAPTRGQSAYAGGMILGIVVVLIGFFVVLHVLGLALWGLFATLAVGLVFGSLGRLVVPGRQRMGLWATALAGVGGAVLGGLIGRAASLRTGFTLLVEVGVAALIVAVWSRRSGRPLAGTRPRLPR